MQHGVHAGLALSDDDIAFLEDVASAKEFTGYICGSDAFVEASVKAFKRRRMSPRRIRRERFTPAG